MEVRSAQLCETNPKTLQEEMKHNCVAVPVAIPVTVSVHVPFTVLLAVPVTVPVNSNKQLNKHIKHQHKHTVLLAKQAATHIQQGKLITQSTNNNATRQNQTMSKRLRTQQGEAREGKRNNTKTYLQTPKQATQRNREQTQNTQRNAKQTNEKSGCMLQMARKLNPPNDPLALHVASFACSVFLLVLLAMLPTVV